MVDDIETRWRVVLQENGLGTRMYAIEDTWSSTFVEHYNTWGGMLVSRYGRRLDAVRRIDSLIRESKAKAWKDVADGQE